MKTKPAHVRHCGTPTTGEHCASPITTKPRRANIARPGYERPQAKTSRISIAFQCSRNIITPCILPSTSRWFTAHSGKQTNRGRRVGIAISTLLQNNAVGIEIRGCVLTYRPDSADSFLGSGDDCDTITSAEDVMWALQWVSDNSNIKAVVLQIDSGGGSPVAAEEIAAELKSLGKPSIAWIRERAGSAAYWIASAATTVIASEGSDVGSIGVTTSYLDNTKRNTTDGLTYNQLT